MGNKIQKGITKPIQLYSLKSKYNLLNVILKGDSLLSCDIPIQSNYYSKTYILHIEYFGKKSPKSYFINQHIMQFKDEYIPHCYKREYKGEKHDKVQICLYYPVANEWNSTMLISDTIVPWAVEWVYYYELWRITGKWLGKGIEHVSKKVE